MQEVVIADPDFPPEEAIELVNQCHERRVAVRIAPTTMEIMTHRHELVPGQTVPLFELKPPVFEGADFVMKRSFDLVVATTSLVRALPVLLGIAVAIKATSPGPALFRSRRPGIGGVPFDCLKFRTMHTDAEQRQEEVESMNEASGALFKIRRDPRLTRIGGLLRRFSLDELPQLVNVLRGDMSMVGPRPLPLRDYSRLDEWHRKRYLVLPGITGLWQVSGRAELDFDELVRLDFLYLERWSVFLDLSILLKTVPAVLRRRGRVLVVLAHEEIWRELPAGAGHDPGRARPGAARARRASGLGRVLDLGRGDGTFAAALAALGAQVTGVDPAPTALARARAGASRARVRRARRGRRPAVPGRELRRGHVRERAAARGGHAVAAVGGAPGARPRRAACRRRAVPRPAAEHAGRPRARSSATTTRSAPSCASTPRGRCATLLHDFGFEQVQVDARGGPPLLRETLIGWAAAPASAAVTSQSASPSA